jgi:hypothetical protein
MGIYRFANSLIRTNRFYEGEGEGEGGEGGEGGNGGGAGTGTTTEKKKEIPKPGEQNPATGKKFTQDEVNRLLKQDKDAAKVERDKLKAELERLKEQGLTTENMTALQERIDQLANEGKTKEEQTKDALAAKDKEWSKKYDLSLAETKKWRTDYDTYRSKSEILAEAGKLKADNPEQVYKILKPDTFMVEKLDANGKGTGEWIPKIRLEVTEDGITKALELSVPDAIKKMTEMTEHANLFNSGASSGIGGNNNGGSRAAGKTAIPSNMNDYMAARKKNPKLLEGIGTDKK